MTTADMDVDAVDPRHREARAAFHELVEAVGQPFGPKIMDPEPGPTGECWTNAWRAAEADPDLTYVEGTVANRGRLDAHAFTVDRAGIVHEHTTGYETAGCYVGIVIDARPGTEAAKMAADVYGDDDDHTSMIEGMLAVGMPRHDILARLGVVIP